MVRRLPVVQTPASDDAEAEARPAWHWVVIGATLTLLIFFPISVVATWISAKLAAGHATKGSTAAVVGAIPVLAAFALSAFSGGAFVGRFGVRARRGSVMLVGGLSGGTLVALAALGGALSPWPVAVSASVVLAAAGIGSALAGARWGRRLRP